MPFDPFADFRMTGQSAIVTGGAQNIGEAIARTFAAAGANVMIAGRNGDKAAATAAAIAMETGRDVRGVACDVTNEKDIARCVDETVRAFGGVSTLVNNVGWGRAFDDPLAVSPEDMIEAYKLNTLSAMQMTAACRPHLLKARNATVTNSGSLVGVLPAFDFIAYSAAKAALNHLMLGLAHYFAKQVRINTILIGTVLTPGYAEAGLDEKAQQALANPNNLTGRAGAPQDVANAFLWLASNAGSWVSGQTIQVSRGRFARPSEASMTRIASGRLGCLGLALLCAAAPAKAAGGFDVSPGMVAGGAEGVERVLTAVEIETSGTTGDAARDTEIIAHVRSSLGLSAGDVFDRTLADGAVLRARGAPGVRNATYRLRASYNPDGLTLLIAITLEHGAERQAVAGLLVDGSSFPALYRGNRALLQLTLNGGSGLFSDGNPWFGNPETFTKSNPLLRYPPLGAQTGARANWMEHYVEYGLAGMSQIGDAPVYAYGAVSGLTAYSRGRDIFRDDARSTTGVEKAYGGLLYVAPEGEFSANISGGRQNFTLNDGFLISQYGSQYNAGPRPGVYLAPRTTQDFAVVGAVKWGNWTLKGFLLDPNEPKTKELDSKTQVAGANLRYNFTPTFYGDITFLTSPRSNTKYFIAGADPMPTRSGVKTFAAHLRWSDRAVMPGVWLEAEGAYQSHQFIPMSAWAGYGTAGYLASWAPWTPSLSYRYAYFSGDKRDTLPYERFDPLFSGGLNEWLQGISLAKVLSQTNSHTQRIRFNVAPTARLNLTLDLFLRRADVMNNLGANPGLGQLKFKDLGKELTFTTRWAISDNFYALGIASLAKPGDAIKAITNTPAKNWTTLQAQLFWTL